MTKWPIVTLSDVFDIARGGSPRPIDSYITESQDGINWIMISDAAEGSKYITRTRKRIRSEGAQRSRTVRPGDFLLTNSMSFGKPYIMRTNGCIHDGWLVLSPRRRDVDSDFFYHLLGSKTLYSEFERRASGATVKNLNIDLVKGVAVPLPPVAEQRRIAEILDKADALRAKRHAALAQLDTLTRSIFFDMFGDSSRNPLKWSEVRLGDLIVDGPQNGLYKPASLYGAGTSILRIDGFYDGEVTRERPIKRVQLSDAERSRYGLRPNDIVINRVNSRQYLGKSALVRSLDEPVVFESNMMRFAVDRDVIEPEYLINTLQTQHVRSQILGRAKDAVNQSSINQEDVKAMIVSVPPLALQQSFARAKHSAIMCEEVNRRSLTKFDALFASLQHRAFRGEL